MFLDVSSSQKASLGAVPARPASARPVSRPKCNGCVQRRVCPFTEVDSAARKQPQLLVSGTEVISTGGRLYRTGDTVSALYFVRSGTFKVCAVSGDGANQVVGFYGAGDVIGLNALSDGYYAYEAVALDTASVCAVPLEVLLGADGGSPGWGLGNDTLNPFVERAGANLAGGAARPTLSASLAGALLISLSRAARRDEKLRLMLARNSATERVAAFLIELVASNRRRGLICDELMLPMSRADIASYLALAVETVSRVLTRLSQRGIVKVNRRRVEILDFAALEQLTQSSVGKTPASSGDALLERREAS